MAQASRDFQVFVKPVGPLCNLACRYCYYTPDQPINAGIETRGMSEKLLETYIVQHITATKGSAITFSWHGGEPTLLGLDFFRKTVALQRKHLPRGKKIFNGVQTNGFLIEEEWCRFLAEEGFSVGLSIDGPRELHDVYRTTRGNEPTYHKVRHAFELMTRNGIHCDILCAVHEGNVRRPLQVYRHFKELGASYISFLPIVLRLPGSELSVDPCTVLAADYGAFLCVIFDEWIQKDIGRVSVQIFEEAIRPLQGSDHSLCIFRKTCGDIPVIERNGDFFSCDHFVNASNRLGNILEVPFVQLLESPAQRAFGEAKRDTLPLYCMQCDVLDMCNGGCPKDRFIRTPEGEPGLNYLCAGFKRFFSHCRPFFLKVIAAAQARRAKAPEAGRNDLCPCGSGLKYKKCCLGKRKNAGTGR